MATLANGTLTLADWAKRLDPDGKVPVVAELLAMAPAVMPSDSRTGPLSAHRYAAERSGGKKLAKVLHAVLQVDITHSPGWRSRHALPGNREPVEVAARCGSLGHSRLCRVGMQLAVTDLQGTREILSRQFVLVQRA